MATNQYPKLHGTCGIGYLKLEMYRVIATANPVSCGRDVLKGNIKSVHTMLLFILLTITIALMVYASNSHYYAI